MLHMERILPLFMAVRRAEKLGVRDQLAEQWKNENHSLHALLVRRP
jgi:hypothetical protein